MVNVVGGTTLAEVNTIVTVRDPDRLIAGTAQSTTPQRGSGFGAKPSAGARFGATLAVRTASRAQLIQRRLELARQRRGQLKALARGRMVEGEAMRVQRLMPEAERVAR